MESSINIMLEGFAVRRYPDWEKVGYQKFDVGYFSHGELNGYGKKYILLGPIPNPQSPIPNPQSPLNLKP